MKSSNKTFMDRVTAFAHKIADPLAKFSNTDVISSVVAGLVAITPIIMIGSIFLIFYVLGSPLIGTSGKALLPFLTPIAEKFAWLNSMTMGVMSLFASVSISFTYAQKKKMSPLTGSLLGISTFMIFTIAGLDKEGGIIITSWGAAGLFVCILTSLISVRIMKIFLDHNITIKMPDSVPPNIGNAFGALFPYAAIFTIAWMIRTVANFDTVVWLSQVLQPLITSSDSVWFAMLATFIVLLLWSAGLHGDNMFLILLTPVGLQWMDVNSKALESGTPTEHLPHVLAAIGQTGLLRLTTWTSAIWPLIVFMLISKRKEHKTLGVTSLAPGIFTIIEPVIYGLPVALNGYLIVPFVLSGTISAGVGYLMMATPWMGKFYALVPWATPPFILGPLGTGDWKSVFIVIVSFAIGLIIYLPFWKVYMKSLEDRDLLLESEKKKGE